MQFPNRISSSTTTTVTSKSTKVSQVVISCSNAGTSWVLKIQDKQGTPMIFVPPFTLGIPSTGPLIIKFDKPILARSGIDIVTSGTAGVVDVWIDGDPSQ